MPVISRIGRRDWKVRFVVWGIYTLLTLGAISMIYPFLLMLSGSVKSDADYQQVSVLPRYLLDDDVLWMKYVESKYGHVGEAEKAYRISIGTWRKIAVPNGAEVADVTVRDFQDFRVASQWPSYWFTLGQIQSGGILGVNTRKYWAIAKEKYGSIAAYGDAVGGKYDSWIQVVVPPTPYSARRFSFPATPDYLLLAQMKHDAAIRDRVVIDLDGIFWAEFLRPQWATIKSYNEAHGTKYTDYRKVMLTRTPPSSGRERTDWEQFVRNDLNLAFIVVSPGLTGKFREYLKSRYEGNIVQLNRRWQSHFGSFDDVLIPPGTSPSIPTQSDLAAFVKDPQSCPLDSLSIYGPRQAFEQFVAERRGVNINHVAPLPLPVQMADYLDFQQVKGEVRWQLFARNYIYVIDYLLLNGNGLVNTVIYCFLAILANLTINPLAAYALSRYRPPGTYKVLLFCMCTMAFPGEVTMIPSFLLLKRFPVFGLISAGITGLAIATILVRLFPKWPAVFKGLVAGSTGLLAGFYVLPHLFGEASTSVSLLNTFWALVLPGAANGFSIFLLKGFFDSLPQELYEAAEIDGAGEFTKFWTISLSLSKPILAVMALGVFVQAYSEFMMALVIIPDPKMWTIMVWLFQFQQTAHPTVVYASLVVAAIPTFAVFLLCQKLIMQGIVVPVEK